MRTVKKNIHWVVLLLILFVFAIHIYILHVVCRFDWVVTLEDGACGSAALLVSAWSIVLIMRAYPTSAAIYTYALFMALIITVSAAVAEYGIMKWMIPYDYHDYKQWLKHTMPIRFIIIWVFNTWIATNSALRKNVTTLESRFQQQTDASVLLKEAELFKLRQQLQPHFLYNSLNSISTLVMIAPDKAQEMIGKLSDFLRSSVKRESEDIIPVSDELNYIQSYLAIESIRFGDRLRVHFKNSFATGATIPPFLLQPILENAIKFGLYGNTGTVNIDIQIASEGRMLTITVTNPYDANMQPPRGTGFGLEGIKRRLYLLFARADLLETKKDEHYFTTILNIPQQYVQGNSD